MRSPTENKRLRLLRPWPREALQKPDCQSLCQETQTRAQNRESQSLVQAQAPFQARACEIVREHICHGTSHKGDERGGGEGAPGTALSTVPTVVTLRDGPGSVKRWTTENFESSKRQDKRRWHFMASGRRPKRSMQRLKPIHLV